MPDHEDEIKQLFGIAEHQDLVNNLIPNFMTFFIRTQLQAALQQLEIHYFVSVMINDSVPETQDSELGMLQAWFSSNQHARLQHLRFSSYLKENQAEIYHERQRNTGSTSEPQEGSRTVSRSQSGRPLLLKKL